MEVYKSADEACDPIRIKMLKRVDVTSSSYLAEDQKRLLKHIIHSLRHTGEDLDKITTCFEQMLKHHYDDVKGIPGPEQKETESETE